jgi:hypothetical protein
VTGDDDQFEDFLRQRKPVFRPPEDPFEPPAEIDRIVLRQAREAIQAERPMRMFSGPRWAAPLALAATLVLAVAVVFQVGTPRKQEPLAEVTVQNAAQRVDYPAAPVAPADIAPEARADDSAGAGDTSSEAVVQLSKSRAVTGEAASPTSSARTVAAPEWRRDSQTWLAEIDRLRNAGDTTRANAELEEYKRQHRALAVAPDR